jgi:protein-S-isoprenylcysteine O-methyltransferase Ste14
MEESMPLSWIFLLLTSPVAAAGLWIYRVSYRRHGQCTAAAMFALCTGWLIVLGLALTVFSMLHFRSLRMVLGRDPSRLVTIGLYRFSRNPQYVFYALFLLGYAMTGKSMMAYLGAALCWVVIHLTVLVEEEHLERVFGEEYRQYKRSVPRYVSLGRG